VESCSADGKHESKACAETDTCREGACVAILKIDTVTQAAPLVLQSGTYALAVVDLQATSATPVPLPVTLTGKVTDPVQNAALIAAAPERTGLRPTCGYRELTGLEVSNATLADAPPQALVAVKVGDARVFHYPEKVTVPERKAKLRLIGKTANFWEDQTDKAAGKVISDAQLKEIARRYDEGALPRTIAAFGKLTDVDGNGKVDVLFTNLLGGPGDGPAAFVTGSTLRPPGYYAGVKLDYGEVVYAMAPDATMDAAALAGTMAHETQHLIYHGRRLAPYLPSKREPADYVGDRYEMEGIAELAHSLSGQSYNYSESDFLREPQYASLAHLFAKTYVPDPKAANPLYGFASLVTRFLFEQAGGVSIKSASEIEDHGGIHLIDQITMGANGPKRLSDKNARPIEQWFPEMAGALLVSSLGGPTAANPAYRFQPAQKDAFFGGVVGAILDGKWVPSLTAGPILKRTPWSKKPATLTGGGMAFFEFTVGTAPVTLKVTGAHGMALVAKH
jgi:hypothetical protein